jgi:hypothetical protein
LIQAEHALGAIDPESFDAEANLALGRFWKRDFIELEDFWAARFVETNDLDCVGHADSWIFAYACLDER